MKKPTSFLTEILRLTADDNGESIRERLRWRLQSSFISPRVLIHGYSKGSE